MLIEHFIKRLPAYNNLFNGKGDINIPPYRTLEPYRGYTWNDMLQIFIMLNSEITSHMHSNGGITFCYEPSAHGTIEIDASNRTILESNGENFPSGVKLYPLDVGLKCQRFDCDYRIIKPFPEELQPKE